MQPILDMWTTTATVEGSCVTQGEPRDARHACGTCKHTNVTLKDCHDDITRERQRSALFLGQTVLLLLLLATGQHLPDGHFFALIMLVQNADTRQKEKKLSPTGQQDE